MSKEIRAIHTVFISYSWDSEEHKQWVRDLAARLREDCVEVTLDRWHTAPGDQLPEFMERAVRESAFVLIICTPRYKNRADGRTGGVGYEGDIITAEVMTTRNQRKFIPILRRDDWSKAAASWLAGKYHIDLRGNPYSEEQYTDLLATLQNRREQAPTISTSSSHRRTESRRIRNPIPSAGDTEKFEPIKIVGVITDAVGSPRNDGTRGSALYTVPLKLSRRPSPEWASLFVQEWDFPPSFTAMHRPGIAQVVGDRIILDGTTIDEVERHHRDTLKLVVKEVNQKIEAYETKRRRKLQQEEEAKHQHEDTVREIASRLKFDD